MPALADPRLQQFCALVQQGVDTWVAAGELLCAIKADDPGAIAKLVKMQPGLSAETLRTFERLGNREIYPPLLTDGSMGAKKLLGLPYDDQVRLHRARIGVAVWKSGEVVVEERALGELSQREAEIAFNCKSLRPIKEQMELVRARKAPSGRAHGPKGNGEAAFVDESGDTADGKLAEAQAAMLRVRELLGERTTAKLDGFITTALRNIGWMRFEMRGGE